MRPKRRTLPPMGGRASIVRVVMVVTRLGTWLDSLLTGVANRFISVRQSKSDSKMG